MFIAALRLLLELKPERIQEYCERLIRGPVERARELGFAVEDAQWRGAHLFGLRVPERLDLKRLHHDLLARHVVASLRGSALRVSPNVYNSRDDLDALVQVLRN